MSKNYCAIEIAHLSQNQINLKIAKVDGYLIRKDKLSWRLQNYYSRRNELIRVCVRSGLNYGFFYERTESVLYVFTHCPPFVLPGQSGDYIIVTIYEWPEDFMASELAAYYRRTRCNNATNSWNEFGYFTTTSKEYNKLPIVIAVAKLRPNQNRKRSVPIDRINRGLNEFLFGN